MTSEEGGGRWRDVEDRGFSMKAAGVTRPEFGTAMGVPGSPFCLGVSGCDPGLNN